jgi:steroid 5-alpha reductase family enzyme
MLYLNSAILIFAFMNLLFFIAILRKDNSLADIGWGMGFILAAVYQLLVSDVINSRQILVSILILLWGIRLSIYIFSRNKGKQEDSRYAKWRKEWGKHWLIHSYLQVFILQGLFMLTIVYPVIFLHNKQANSLNWLDLAGVIIWLTGFIFESVADYQKNKFKQIPGNSHKLMDTGLWKLSRHPNYFGESLMWWGVFLVVLNVQHGILAVFSPVMITFLLTKVSGIPLIEKQHKDDPVYQDYIKRTSAFLPWKPKIVKTK